MIYFLVAEVTTDTSGLFPSLVCASMGTEILAQDLWLPPQKNRDQAVASLSRRENDKFMQKYVE